MSKQNFIPSGYVLPESTVSPDRHFGFLIPQYDRALEGTTPPIFIVQLVSGSLIAELSNIAFMSGQRYGSLSVSWSQDSTGCIVVAENRFGLDAAEYIELYGNKSKQFSLGPEITAQLESVIGTIGNPRHNSLEAYIAATFSEDGSLHIRAIATNNPKQHHNHCPVFASFRGTFQNARGKWTSSMASPISGREFDSLMLQIRTTAPHCEH